MTVAEMEMVTRLYEVLCELCEEYDEDVIKAYLKYILTGHC